MTSFDDKEKAAENKYARDKEQEFKIHARAHKLLGLWAAGKMGLSGPAAEDYARGIVTMDLEKVNHQHLLEKIKADLMAKDIEITEPQISAEIRRLEDQARQQITG